MPGDGGKTTALTIPAVSGLSTTYLAKLVLTNSSGAEVSRNVYWLSTKADTIDWNNTDWYYTPTTSYADLKGLSSLAQVPVSSVVSSSASGADTVTTVTLKNTTTSKIPAFFVDAHIIGAGGKPVLPVQWNDNAVSLWPGESVVLRATYRTSDLQGATPSVRVSGWNTVPDNGQPGPAVYEAEDAAITAGAVESNHAGFTGRGFVNYDNAVGSAVEWTVNAATAGPADVVLRYANGTTATRPMNIALNGTVVSSGLTFPGTGNWDTWQTKTVRMNLVAGSNKIKATATTADGGPNVDKLTVG